MPPPPYRETSILWALALFVLLILARCAPSSAAGASFEHDAHTHEANASAAPPCLHSSTRSLQKLYGPLFKHAVQNVQGIFASEDVFSLVTTTSDEEGMPEVVRVPMDNNNSATRRQVIHRLFQAKDDNEDEGETRGRVNSTERAGNTGATSANKVPPRFNATFNKKLDKDHYQPIRVRFDLSALFDTDKFCSSPYERRAHGLDSAGEDNTVVCAPADVLTKEKRDYLLNRVLPRVTHLMESLLKVYPYRSPLTFRENICGDLFSKYPSNVHAQKHGAAASKGTADYAQQRGEEGLGRRRGRRAASAAAAGRKPAMRSSNNTDLLIFAMAVPTPEGDNRTVAWSGLCGVDKSTHRPTVARINFVPRHIFPTSASSFYNIFLTAYTGNDEAQRRIRFVQANDGHSNDGASEEQGHGIFSFFDRWGVVGHKQPGVCPSLKTGPRDDAFSLWTEQYTNSIKHELFHVLGFNPLYLKARSAKRPIGENSLATVDDTYKPTYRIVTEPRVVAVARHYFNCSHVEGVPLEDEGGDGTAGTHWERRVLRDELMSGVLTPLASVLSPFTLLFLDSLPFYRVNVGSALAAETAAVPSHEVEMQWGRGAGCDFLNVTTCRASRVAPPPHVPLSSFSSSTVAPASTSVTPASLYWCAPRPYLQCSSDRTSFGLCSGIRKGGALLMDKCPIVEAHPLGSCVLPSQSAPTTYPLEEEDGVLPAQTRGGRASLLYHGSDARCFMTGSVRTTRNAAAEARAAPDRVACIRTRCLPRILPSFTGSAQQQQQQQQQQRGVVPWSVQLQVQVSGVWLSCPEDGSAGHVVLMPNVTGLSGYVFCDAASAICTPESSHLFYFEEPETATGSQTQRHDISGARAARAAAAAAAEERRRSRERAVALGEEHAFYVTTMEALLLIEAEHATEKVDTSLFHRCREQVSLAVEKDLLPYLRYGSSLFGKDSARLFSSTGGSTWPSAKGAECHIAVEKVHVLSLSYVPLVDPARAVGKRSARDDTSTFVTITASVVLRSTCRSVSQVRSALFAAQKAAQRDAKRNVTDRRQRGGASAGHRHANGTAGFFGLTYALWLAPTEYCRFAGTTVSPSAQMVVNFVPPSLIEDLSGNLSDADRINDTAVLAPAVTAAAAAAPTRGKALASSSITLYGAAQVNTDSVAVVDRVRSNVALLSAPVTSHLVAVADVHNAFYLHYTVIAPGGDKALYTEVQKQLGLPTSSGGSGGRKRPKGEKRHIPLLSCPSVFFKKSFLGDVSTLLGIHRTWMDLRELSLSVVPRRHGERNRTHHHVTFFVRATMTMYLSRHTLVGLQAYHENKGTTTTDDVLRALRARWREKLLFSHRPAAGGKLTGAPAYAYLSESVALRYLTAAGRVLHVANCTVGVEEVRLVQPLPLPLEKGEPAASVVTVLDRAWPPPPRGALRWSRTSIFVGWFALLTAGTLALLFLFGHAIK